MKYWTTRHRGRRGHRPMSRVDMRGPLGHANHVTDGNDWQRLGRFTLQKRGELGLSQSEVAALMDVNTKTVRTIEKGRPVALRTVTRIDAAFRLASGTALAVLEGRPIPGGDDETAGEAAADEYARYEEFARAEGVEPTPEVIASMAAEMARLKAMQRAIRSRESNTESGRA
jgi:DNA-binding XRE family transcriptional regulator